ncbi:uncharacterized protein LOC124170543 [Ischnura elegans]|uniref:uncharacterized protein LOC124170543 n=1 Tax=Ischnura elegans TaxID=197161 RepID=UPI001ED87502|nr:uncharacterized protein LOC124170543 [Ischnura elegans]
MFPVQPLHRKHGEIEPEHRGNLRSHIVSLYGEDVDRLIRRFEKLRGKKGRLLSSLAFLLRCRDTDTIPVCVEISHHLKTSSAKRILLRASKALLRERVHHTRLSLHRCSEELYKIHLQWRSSLNATDWDKIEKITYFTSQNVEITARKTQIKKFDKLHNMQHPSDQHLRDRSVVNLTERVLDDATTSVISKGHNFAIAPKNLPMERIITEVESAIRKLPKDDAAEIREDVSHILRTARPPKQNLSAAEREALSKFKSDESHHTENG